MNKFLMGTTALVAASAFTAPVIAAERIQLSVRGYSTQGISYVDADRDFRWVDTESGGAVTSSGGYDTTGDYNEINFGTSSEIHFIGSLQLDNGLEVTFHTELELEADSDAWQYYYEGNDTIDEVYVQFDGGFGRVQFGQQDGVMDQMAVTSPSTFHGHSHNDLEDRSMDPFDGVVWGGNPINTVGDLSGDHIKLIYFTPSMNGLQLGFSFTPNPCKNHTGYSECVYEEFGRNYWEVSGTWAASYNNVAFEFSGGYGQGEGWLYYDDPSEWTAGANISFGGFTIGGSYRDRESAHRNTWGLSQRPLGGRGSEYDAEDWEVGVTYESGPWGFNLAYGSSEREQTYACDWSCVNRPPGPSGPGVYHYEQESESWIGGITYAYGPGMQFGFGVQTLDRDDREGSRRFDFIPGGTPTGAAHHETEGFDGVAVFFENTIKF